MLTTIAIIVTLVVILMLMGLLLAIVWKVLCSALKFLWRPILYLLLFFLKLIFFPMFLVVGLFNSILPKEKVPSLKQEVTSRDDETKFSSGQENSSKPKARSWIRRLFPTKAERKIEALYGVPLEEIQNNPNMDFGDRHF